MAENFTAIPDGDVDPESPITTSLMQALRDNPEGIAGGASGAPDLAAVTGASLVLLAQATASNDASVVFNTMDSTYDVYIIELTSFVPATDGAALYLRTIPSGGGSTGDSGASDYDWVRMTQNSGAAGPSAGSSTGDSKIPLSVGNVGKNSGEHISGTITVRDPDNASIRHLILGEMEYIEIDNESGTTRVVGHREEAAAIIGVEVFFDSGNITSGTARLYGVKKS